MSLLGVEKNHVWIESKCRQTLWHNLLAIILNGGIPPLPLEFRRFLPLLSPLSSLTHWFFIGVWYRRGRGGSNRLQMLRFYCDWFEKCDQIHFCICHFSTAHFFFVSARIKDIFLYSTETWCNKIINSEIGRPMKIIHQFSRPGWLWSATTPYLTNSVINVWSSLK